MSDLNCPICVTTALGQPYRFAGRWLAACATCHAETELHHAGDAGATRFRLTGALNLATLRKAEQYRRRTAF